MYLTIANHNNEKNPKHFKNYNIEHEDLVDEISSGFCYCACKLKDEYRLDKNFDGHVDYLVIDIDENCTIETAKKLFRRYEYDLVTTRNHQKNKGGLTCDRFRLFFRLTKTIHSRQEIEDIYLQFISNYQFIDEKCKNVSRLFFSSPSTAYKFHNDGKRYDTRTIPPLKAINTPSPIPEHTLTHSDAIFRYCDATEKWENDYGEVLDGEGSGEIDDEAKLRGVQTYLDNEYTQGQKGNTLFKASAMMKKDGFSDDFISNYLLAEWTARGSSTDKMKDAMQNIRGGLKCG